MSNLKREIIPLIMVVLLALTLASINIANLITAQAAVEDDVFFLR